MKCTPACCAAHLAAHACAVHVATALKQEVLTGGVNELTSIRKSSQSKQVYV